MCDEHFRVAGRTNFYETADQIEKDFQLYLKLYNNKKSHQGKNINGRTPDQFFLDGFLELEKEEDQ
ncbi:ISDvu4, transposase [Leptospira vanthielii serovar Holland str. Waz Holland = ATCC 700522]|uniref:ISDvu4, transposase n=1 Tax=Leptospira vanthielii serovar Holland str. Waz Holland = ATCC 700522 TaxID=1218591 RepID=N1WA85_9LEPT|nr:ISDvu4, transposase [Leptospira vanthielii serovar Holland str. Waz Holland = ATCC 700522]